MQAFRATDSLSIRHADPSSASAPFDLRSPSSRGTSTPRRLLRVLAPRVIWQSIRSLLRGIRSDLGQRHRGPRALALQRSRLTEAARGASLLTGSGLTLAFLIIGVMNASVAAAPWLLGAMALCWAPAVFRHAVDPMSRVRGASAERSAVEGQRGRRAGGTADEHAETLAVTDAAATTRSIRVFTFSIALQALALGALGAVSLRFGNASAQLVTHACLVAALAMSPGTIGTLPSTWVVFNLGLLGSALAGIALMRPQWLTLALPLLLPAALALLLIGSGLHMRIRARIAQAVRLQRLSRRLHSVKAQARRMTLHLEQQQAEMSVLLDNSNLAMLLVRNQWIVRASAAAIELFGPGTEGMDVGAIMSRIKRDNDDPMDSIMRSALLGREARAEIRLLDEMGQPRWYALVCAPVPDGNPGHAIWTFFDQTEAVRSRLEATRSAATDALTGLPNRTGLLRYVQSMQRSRNGPREVTLGFIDLNGFKALNDRFGHAVGDEVLRQFGQRLGQAAGARACAARLGGDEFVLVIPAIDGTQAAHARARAMLDAACVPVELSGDAQSITPAAALGLSDFSLDGRGFDEALLLADHAMYKAKRERRSRATRAARPASVDTRTKSLFDDELPSPSSGQASRSPARIASAGRASPAFPAASPVRATRPRQAVVHEH